MHKNSGQKTWKKTTCKTQAQKKGGYKTDLKDMRVWTGLIGLRKRKSDRVF
jgi:hypothetical protein